MNSVDFSHAVSTGLITVGVAKGWTLSQGLDVPMMPQVEGGLAAGVSAVVVDSVLPTQTLLVRSGATGVVLSGAMWAWKGDTNWQVWLPVGAASYWLSDWVMKMLKDRMAKTMNASSSPDGGSSMPEVSNM